MSKMSLERITQIIRNSSIGITLREELKNWPGYQQINDGRKFFRLKSQLRLTISFVSETFQMSRESRQKLKSTRLLKNSCKGKILVLGNGPSSKNISENQVRYFTSNGGKLLVMNGFINSDLSRTLKPDYYILVDPSFWDQDSFETQDFLFKFKAFAELKLQNCIIIQPAIRPKIMLEHDHYIYTDGRSLAGLCKFNQPHKPWCYPASVSLLAISTLKFLGYNEIYFAGLDADSYKNFFVNDLNTIMFDASQNYFYELSDDYSEKVGSQIREMRDWPLRHMSDALFAAAIFFRDQREILKNCINVGNDRTNDACSRASLIKPPEGIF